MDIHSNRWMQCRVYNNRWWKSWGSPEERESVLQKVRTSKGFTVEVLSNGSERVNSWVRRFERREHTCVAREEGVRWCLRAAWVQQSSGSTGGWDGVWRPSNLLPCRSCQVIWTLFWTKGSHWWISVGLVSIFYIVEWWLFKQQGEWLEREQDQREDGRMIKWL